MFNIRYLQEADRAFWYELDKHLPENEFANKIKDKRAYVLLEDDKLIGLLRYNLFWDEIPFCTMISVHENYQGKGYGRMLLKQWEKEMKQSGYNMLMTSTQVDETAQHFYRKLGYCEAGGLLINISERKQPMEIFFIKAI